MWGKKTHTQIRPRFTWISVYVRGRAFCNHSHFACLYIERLQKLERKKVFKRMRKKNMWENNPVETFFLLLSNVLSVFFIFTAIHCQSLRVVDYENQSSFLEIQLKMCEMKKNNLIFKNNTFLLVFFRDQKRCQCRELFHSFVTKKSVNVGKFFHHEKKRCSFFFGHPFSFQRLIKTK